MTISYYYISYLYLFYVIPFFPPLPLQWVPNFFRKKLAFQHDPSFCDEKLSQIKQFLFWRHSPLPPSPIPLSPSPVPSTHALLSPSTPPSPTPSLAPSPFPFTPATSTLPLPTFQIILLHMTTATIQCTYKTLMKNLFQVPNHRVKWNFWIS